ncbi:unnamed protein product [Medioppia subpectinata]|uniref:Uncharacterized protein n=1 Tax=Medioppia subpectinata TaxID=1979941 RepID=A0A7R9LD20_9ACAR|nr:unnamed protein product [Medioppia subpectinata]CAG2117848.1 unnamed protein product [Medioppia subpectinata]
MSSIPFTTFSAIKVHQTIKQEKDRQKTFGGTQSADMPNNKYTDRSQHNYNSKYMNSVWGLYNRYAPQAFQKNEELFLRSKAMTASSNANFAEMGSGGAV